MNSIDKWEAIYALADKHDDGAIRSVCHRCDFYNGDQKHCHAFVEDYEDVPECPYAADRKRILETDGKTEDDMLEEAE
jgi:hypothetical protein